MNTVKRRISFYIGIGQLDEELDDEPICDKLNLYYNKISKTLNEGDLDGWKLNFLIVLRPTDAIGIAKPHPTASTPQNPQISTNQRQA